MYGCSSQKYIQVLCYFFHDNVSSSKTATSIIEYIGTSPQLCNLQRKQVMPSANKRQQESIDKINNIGLVDFHLYLNNQRLSEL